MHRLAVDLGTTFTAAAIDRGGRVEMVPLGNQGLVVPSVVHVSGDGVVVVGEAAVRRGLDEPDGLAREFKRRLGDPVPLLLSGIPVSPEWLTARLLETAMATVSAREGGPPAVLVLTHPASWSQYQRDLLVHAARLADVEAPCLVAEPVAVASHYATLERVDEGEAVAVYDLGGGTFDAAVVRRIGGRFEIVGEPEGIQRLGGVDFDEAVLGWVLRAVGGRLPEIDLADPATTAAVARLRRECVEAKEALSADTHATIVVAFGGVETSVRLSRTEFEAMVRAPLDETVTVAERAIRSAGLSAADVATVLLAGGSSRIPLVAEVVAARLGRPVATDAHPKHSAALGALVAPAEPAVASRPAIGVDPSRSGGGPGPGPGAGLGAGVGGSGDPGPRPTPLGAPSGDGPRHRGRALAAGGAVVGVAALLVIVLLAGGGDGDGGPGDGGEPPAQLAARSILPAMTFEGDEPSGHLVEPPEGFVVPFPGQPVAGFSALHGDADGTFLAASDNGFGARSNSWDFLLRVHRVAPDPGSGVLSVAGGGFGLSDPYHHVQWPVWRDGACAATAGLPEGYVCPPPDRLLTGYDFDPESMQVLADGTIWFGDEFGPFLLHTDPAGRLIAPPLTAPGVVSPQHPVLGSQVPTLGDAVGFEGLARAIDGLTLHPMLQGPLADDVDAGRTSDLRILEARLVGSGAQWTETAWRYRLEDPAHAVGDLVPIDDDRFLVVERDAEAGPTARFKVVFLVDARDLDGDGYVDKTPLVDLLALPDPTGVAGPAGATFTFPFAAVEALALVDDQTLALVNDNDFPTGHGRSPDQPDDTELILVHLAEPLGAATELLPGG